MRQATWDEILGKLDSVLDLCRSLGFTEAVDRSRFLRHRERLVALIEQLLAGGPDGARTLYDTDRLAHIVALSETGELATIEEYLRASDAEKLRRKLRDVLGGPVLPDEEDENSNHARNILFELNLAAKLSAGGLPITLGDPPDLACELEGKTLLIECKRPLTVRGARKRIRQARTTLTAQAKKRGPGVRGIVALSVTKVINPGDQIFSASTEQEARQGLHELLGKKAMQLSDAWSQPGSRVIGVLFHVITPAFFQDTKAASSMSGSNRSRIGSWSWRSGRQSRGRHDGRGFEGQGSRHEAQPSFRPSRSGCAGRWGSSDDPRDLRP